MKILTSKSIAKLKIAFKENNNLIDKSIDELTNELTLAFVERYKFDQNIQLLEPTGSSIADSKDKENCILIYQALPELIPLTLQMIVCGLPYVCPTINLIF